MPDAWWKPSITSRLVHFACSAFRSSFQIRLAEYAQRRPRSDNTRIKSLKSVVCRAQRLTRSATQKPSDRCSANRCSAAKSREKRDARSEKRGARSEERKVNAQSTAEFLPAGMQARP